VVVVPQSDLGTGYDERYVIPPRWQLTASVAYSVTTPRPYRPAAWSVTKEATARIEALATATAFDGADSWLFRHRSFALSDGAPRDMLWGAMAGAYSASIDHVRRVPWRVVSWSFGVNGGVRIVNHDVTALWQSGLDELVGTVCALPDITDIAFIRRRRTYGVWEGYRWADNSPDRSDRRFKDRDRDRLRDTVPDADGIMVLTEAHLERAADLSLWNVDEIGSGRFLLKARDLAAWFETEDPPQELRAQARAVLGDEIFSV
jgi:hypothetical protein